MFYYLLFTKRCIGGAAGHAEYVMSKCERKKGSLDQRPKTNISFIPNEI